VIEQLMYQSDPLSNHDSPRDKNLCMTFFWALMGTEFQTANHIKLCKDL